MLAAVRTVLHPRPARACRGLTLVELTIALVIAAMLGAMALPSFAAMLQQRRLAAAAQALAADLGEARQEAIRRGQPVTLRFGWRAADWCYELVAGAGQSAPTDCAGADPRLLKRVRASDHPGITVVDAMPMTLAPDGATPLLQAPSTLLANARGEQLRVRLSRLGRAAICAPAAAVGTTPRC